MKEKDRNYTKVCACCCSEFFSYRRDRKYCSHECYIKARFGENMKLDGDQFERQKAHETALYYLNLLHSKGMISKSEHLRETAYIEKKYKPMIVHIPLLNKE